MPIMKVRRLFAGLPDSQFAMQCRKCEIVVTSEQHQIMANAKVRKKCVYGSQLYTSAPEQIAKLRSIDIVLPLRCQQRQSGKSFHDSGSCAGTGETLQQLLEYQSSHYDGLAASEGGMERPHMRVVGGAIAS